MRDSEKERLREGERLRMREGVVREAFIENSVVAAAETEVMTSEWK